MTAQPTTAESPVQPHARMPRNRSQKPKDEFLTTEATNTPELQIQDQMLQIPALWCDESQNGRRTPLKEARALQRLIFDNAADFKTTPLVRSHLARAWCVLQTSIREMRGIPLPGILRPDLPPMKGLKGKRGKGSPVLDLPAAQAFSEAVEKVKAEARAAGAQLDTEERETSESAAPEGNPPESKTRATPAPKPSTKPAPKPKE